MVVAIIVIVAGAAALIALISGMLRRQRDQEHRLYEQAARHEHELELRLADAEERARLAAELHDIIVLQLDQIARSSDPAAQRAAAQARGELARLRDVLHLGEPPVAPAALDQLPALVERVRADGLPVTLHVEGERGMVPPSLEASAYQIVAETLAYALDEADDAPTSVRVVWRHSVLGVQVRVAARITGEELDTLGLEQRAALYDGDFRAGPHTGGFEVTATLPLP